ncbi:hypothetical protein FO647_10090, partial [Riemerella anatipestifer]|nr:hypothetical protein [Riemerella anatipestifer]
FASGGLKCKIQVLYFYENLYISRTSWLRKPARTQSPRPLAVSLKKDTNKMNKEIISKIIGRLRQDESFPDWWKSE